MGKGVGSGIVNVSGSKGVDGGNSESGALGVVIPNPVLLCYLS